MIESMNAYEQHLNDPPMEHEFIARQDEIVRTEERRLRDLDLAWEYRYEIEYEEPREPRFYPDELREFAGNRAALMADWLHARGGLQCVKSCNSPPMSPSRSPWPMVPARLSTPPEARSASCSAWPTAKAMFLDLDVAQRIDELGVKARQPFYIVKNKGGKRADPVEWRVWLSPGGSSHRRTVRWHLRGPNPVRGECISTRRGYGAYPGAVRTAQQRQW